MKKNVLLIGLTLLLLSTKVFSQNCENDVTYYSIEEAMKEPEKVKRLDLAMQSPKLTAVPKEVANFPNLECLDVSFNRVATIPEEIKQCKNLKYINLQGNRYLRSMPAILKDIPSLKVVDASGIPEWSAEKRTEAKAMLPGVTVVMD